MSFAATAPQECGQAEDAFAASQSSLSSSLATEELLDVTDSQFSSWATMGCSAGRVHQCMPCLAASDKACGGAGALHVDPLAHTPTALLAAARAAAKPCIDERLKAASGPRTLWTRLMRLVNNDDFVSGLFVGVAAGVAISFYAQRRARTRSRRVITDSLHDKQAELDRLAHLLKHCLSMLLNKSIVVLTAASLIGGHVAALH